MRARNLCRTGFSRSKCVEDILTAAKGQADEISAIDYPTIARCSYNALEGAVSCFLRFDPTAPG
ncbi:hypothetical protein [Qipengyuania huizhouensis]|uniref:hypothetical protein n=1 Tax=Qipengyuania huizhouensis TaxID=2867245 RepID=UPI001C87F0EA|nr:hypothetical protein [Qipengyuania huizhouensis]MBX7461789.1 hypothetical protein [Qipengyuania huizhouensis]